MKVSELQRQLQDMDPDLEVRVTANGMAYHEPISVGVSEWVDDERVMAHVVVITVGEEKT